jgi:stress responsive alpha/beta barrel protein
VIAHIILLQPRPDLTDRERGEALEAFRRAAIDIPEVRRFRLGRRVKHGLPGYEQVMAQDLEYALIVEVDDVDALKRYLQAPAHEAMGGLFYTAAKTALAYDYALEELGP